ncbi:hypothetical protein D187_010132 [Cystobacter fuscus DSM 2262]|nr:hypothetical protein D187_010132 [Cystobacter fuscus DSM 2262]
MLWQHRAPGVAPNVRNGEFPWYYEVHPRGEGFLIVNSWEREYGTTSIDFGCAEVLDGKQANRLLLMDGQGACTRSLGIEYVPTGVATSGEDFWISRCLYHGAGVQWPSMQRRDAMNQVLTDVMVNPPPPYLTHVSQSTLLSWGDGKLSRRSESFEPLWSHVLPIFGQENPAELPDGQLGVVGRRSRSEGFTFGTSVIPLGDDFVMVRFSGQGKPLGAVATGIPTREIPGQPRAITTDALGMIVAGGEANSVVALSWTGSKQWERAVKDMVPELCLPKVHSVASHARYGVRVVGLGYVPAVDGTCEETPQSQRIFVMALTR